MMLKSIKQNFLVVAEELLHELEENEYYANDLIGSEVVNEAEELLGELSDILFLPANDVWVVKRQGKKIYCYQILNQLFERSI